MGKNSLERIQLEKLKRVFIRLSKYQKMIQREERILKKLRKEYENQLKRVVA